MKMWDQVHGVQKKIAPIIANAVDGVNLICYSQGTHTNSCISSCLFSLLPPSPGGLTCRGFLEAYPDHNVKTFISLSGPHAGQFGGIILLLSFK